MVKTLVGPRLRQLRKARRQTQAQMAAALGISPAYVNLLENNQRSLSVKVLVALTENYGIDWRDLVQDDQVSQLSELRSAVRDPAFSGNPPDLQELRAALDHAPGLVRLFLESVQIRPSDDARPMQNRSASADLSRAAAQISDVFWSWDNHIPLLEQWAESAGIAGGPPTEAALRDAIADYGAEPEEAGSLAGEGFGYRRHRLAALYAAKAASGPLATLLSDPGFQGAGKRALARSALIDYAARALLMPYDAILAEAVATAYDLEAMTHRFGVRIDHLCQRLATLQRPGAAGVPVFCLVVDRAGQVRHRSGPRALRAMAEAALCPAWRVFDAFDRPGGPLPQWIAPTDGGAWFTLAHRVDPGAGRRPQAVVIGCNADHAPRFGHGRARTAPPTPVAADCIACPHVACPEHRVHGDLSS